MRHHLKHKAISINPRTKHSTEQWLLQPWGEGLFAFSRMSNVVDSKTVCILDVGSNSTKLISYDCTKTPSEEIPYGKCDRLCGLGEGQIPNDPHPILNRDGLEQFYNEFLPSCRAVVDDINPDTIFVKCTEAVRAALANPAETETVKELINKIAKELDIDPKAINILTSTQEAILSAEGVLFGDEFFDGYSITTGGLSSQIVKYSQGHTTPEHRETLRFGTRSLKSAINAKAIVEHEIEKVDWFKSEALTAKGCGAFTDKDRAKHLCLEGGAFRIVGRLLAQRINRIDFRADAPFGGYTFAWNQNLVDTLHGIRAATYDSVLDDCLRFEYRQRQGIKSHVTLNARKYNSWRIKFEKSKEGVQWSKRYNKRIGRRLEFVQAAVDILLAADERIKPRTVVIGGRRSTREGALRIAGLA